MASIPSVLVVLVARNGAPWLQECLEGLSSQTHERLGVVAFDGGSTDPSRELLVRALGEGRVFRSDQGIPGALAAAVKLEAAQTVDYLMLLHDDAVLAPDAITRLVEAAEAIGSVGVVGAKLVEWDNHRVLQDIGWSADRFGHAYSPLEPGEIDQGQYDRIREVLFVSDAAMLISKDAIVRAGLPDERLGSHYEELDFCWRVRLAGFRIVMTPLALVAHRDAGRKGERKHDRVVAHRRYYEERGALVAVSKNYGLGSVWVIPLYLMQGLIKLGALFVARRFGEAGDMLAAWGWHTLRFPGTVIRRVKAQAVRSVKDREIHRYMAHGNVGLRRWLDAAGRFVPGDVQLPGDEEEEPAEAPPLSERASSAARDHPVAAAWVIGIVVAILGYRHLYGRFPLTGGGLPAVLPAPGEFLRELVSGVRTTVLGGDQAGSPALGAMGVASGFPLSSTALVEKALIMALPLLAAIFMYRAALSISAQRVASLVAAGFYVAAPLSVWSFSTGRIPLLVMLAVLPKVTERMAVAFGPVPPARRWRFIVGTGVFVAIGLAFYPGAILAIALMAITFLFINERSGRRFGGLLMVIAFALAGLALVFPMVVGVIMHRGAGIGSMLGVPDVDALSRLVLIPGKGDWPISWILPALALGGFAISTGSRRTPAARAMFAAIASLGLAWASAAGWLPAVVSNPAAFLAVAAVSYCSAIALGLTSALSERPAVSIKRVFSSLAITVSVAGLFLQSLLVVWGSWDIGRHGLPPAWPLVASGETGDFRILWIGENSGLPFPAPGGEPMGVFEDGKESLRYALTDREGVSALDVGRSQFGDGYTYVEAALAELASGRTDHVGAVLAPLAVRFVVAGDGDLPAAIRDQLDEQADIDLVPAGGLLIYRSDSAYPPAAVWSEPELGRLTAPLWPAPAPLTRAEGGWDGPGGGTNYYVSQQWEPGWRLTGGRSSPSPVVALGWAMSWEAPPGSPSSPGVSIRYHDQWIRTAEMAGLAFLWLIALWTTRKPARR